MNRLCVALTASALFTMGARSAETRSLQIGDPAPRLQVMAWIKGKPVTRFVPRQVYVVEFWASWCGPCNRTMPVLSAIQKKYAGRLTVIGVNARETEQTEGSLEYIKNFVACKGALMAYTVAMDDPVRHPAFDAWMTVAGAYGIPTTFIVDRSGRLVWVGHPNDAAGEKFEQAVAQALNAERAILPAHERLRLNCRRRRQNISRRSHTDPRKIIA